MWLTGAICMILFGAASLFIGVYLPMWEYAILGGILLVVGIIMLVSFRRTRGPLPRDY